jgi:hypothetical protein
MLLDKLEPLVFSQRYETSSCHLTKTELRQLHRRFRHPSVGRLKRLLDRSGHKTNLEEIKRLNRFCHHCQKHGRSPGRFKFTLKDDHNFNHTVYLDVFYVDNEPILHVIDESTRFQAARFLKSMSAKHAWDGLRACWIDVYQGPPDYIIHDPGTNFHSKEFRDNAKSLGSDTRVMPIEAHNAIGLVERYHVPLKRAYRIVS